MELLQVFDYLGVFVFAITGAMLAAKKEMDVFGFVVLALMPAIGGGTLRDLILSEPVFWLSDTNYLFITLLAALITFFAIPFMSRLSDVLLWFDARPTKILKVLVNHEISLHYVDLISFLIWSLSHSDTT